MFCVLCSSFPSAGAGDFGIWLYYSEEDLAGDNFGWDYALMDMARTGCERIVWSYYIPDMTQFCAAAKHWDIKMVQAYNILNNYDPNYYCASCKTS